MLTFSGHRWPHKPPIGYRLDPEHPLASGLMGFYALNENSGNTLYDATGKLPLVATGFGGATLWGAGSTGGVLCTTNAAGFIATLPAALQIGWPVSFACGFRQLGAPTIPTYFGALYNSGAGGPFFGWGFSFNGAPAMVKFNSGGTAESFTTSFTPSTGVDTVLSCSLGPNSQAAYAQGASVFSGTTSYSNPSYTGSSQLAVGIETGTSGRQTNALIYWCAWWNRLLSPVEHASLYVNPWQVYRPRRAFFGLMLSTKPVYSFTGTSSGINGRPSPPFTVSPNLSTSDTITLSDGAAGGTFSSGTTLTFTVPSTPQTLTYTPLSGTLGAITLTATSTNGDVVNGSPFTYTSLPTPVPYTLTGPGSAVAGVPSSAFTLTPGGTVASDTVTFSDGAGGVFTPPSLTFTATSAAQHFTYTPATAGTKTITLTSLDQGIITGSPFSLSVTAVGFTLSGPASGGYLAQSSAFALTPNSATNDTVTFSDGGHGGTFAPASLAFTIGSAAAQAFTYTPASVGIKSLAATSADGGTIAGSPASYYQAPTAGSIRFTNVCVFGTAAGNTSANALLASQASATLSFRIQFNTIGGSGLVNDLLMVKGTRFPISFVPGTAGTIQLRFDGAGNNLQTVPSFQVGTPNHVVFSWASGAQVIYFNGSPIATGSFAITTVSTFAGAMLIGPESSCPVDFQISDVAIWDGYAATAADVVNLYAGIKDPISLATSPPVSAWWPLGVTTTPIAVASDPGFLDWTGNGNSIATLAGGSLANASDGGALGFTPPVAAEAYVSKSGKLAIFQPVSTVPASNGAYVPQAITSIPSNPTITWNGQAIQADGPVWDSVGQTTTFAAWRLQCGSVESVGIANSGTSAYTAPSVTAATADGNGIAPTFGTPTLGTGILAYTVSGISYGSAPSIAMAGGTYTTAPSASVVFTAGTVTVVPTAGGILGCGSGVTASPTFTLSGGSPVGGVQATVTPIRGLYIQSVPVLTPGSGLTRPPILTVVDTGAGTGTGASLVPVMSGASPGDVLSYTASWGWLLSAAGGAVESPPPGSSTPAILANFAGKIEGQVGLLAGFPTARTMKVGLNTGSYQSSSEMASSCFRNYMKRVDMEESGWAVSAGNLTVAADGTPVSWTNAAATLSCEPVSVFSGLGSNPIDGRNTPLLVGTWTLIYDDPNVGTGTAAAVTLGGITANCTVVAGTPTISGITVTLPYTVSYLANPTTWNLGLTIGVVQSQGLWHLSNFALIPPQPVGYPVSRTPAMAMDGNVVAWLTTPRNRVPACLRTMDVCADQGISNFIDPTDLPDPNGFSWGNPEIISGIPGTSGGTAAAHGNITISGVSLSGTATFPNIRPYITDPSLGSIASGGNGTYNWAITGRLYFSPTTPYGVSGTDSFGPYLQLPPGDNGQFAVVGGGGPNGWVAIELDFGAPHGFRTGQILSITGTGIGNLPVVGTAGHASLFSSSNVAYVTGVDTVMVTTGMTLNGVGVSIAGTTIATLGVNSTTPLTTEVAVTGCTATVQVPLGRALPVESVAAMASQLGSDLWISVPGFASPATSAEWARRVAANLTPGLKVYVEYMNEHWNSTTNQYTVQFMGGLMARLPTGTAVGNYYTTNGVVLSSSQVYTVLSAMHHDTWEGVFAGLGRGGDVVRVFGGQWVPSGPSVTHVVISMASQCGIPMDAVAVAPYYDYSGSTSMTTAIAAFSPAGSAGTPGNWPMDAIIDFRRHYDYYNAQHWTSYAQNAPLLAAWGQPTNAPAVSIGGSGGSLAQGTYYIYCTFVDSTNRETTVGASQASAIVSVAGQVVTLTLPPLPNWLAGGSANVYMTPVNNLPGTEVLYASGLVYRQAIATVQVNSSGVITGLTILDPGSGYQASSVPVAITGGGGSGASITANIAGNVVASFTVTSGGTGFIAAPVATIPSPTFACTAANTGTIHPPATNQIPGRAPPVLVGYEGALQSLIPGGTPFRNQLARDMFYHPAYYDLITAYFAAQQTGNPGVPGSGLALANYYQLTRQWAADTNVWSMAVSTSQSAGYGLSNQFATPQGGSPGDNRAHDRFNQAVAVQAARDWWDAGGSTRKNRYFSGLRRPTRTLRA